MFLPYTPDSRLKTMLTRLEGRLGYRTRFKYVEEMGHTLTQMLCRKDPTPSECRRQDCMTCRSKPGACLKEGIVYKMTCQSCEEAGRKTLYFDESARTSLKHLKIIWMLASLMVGNMYLFLCLPIDGFRNTTDQLEG